MRPLSPTYANAPPLAAAARVRCDSSPQCSIGLPLVALLPIVAPEIHP